jgi:hypothetical protein
MMKVLPEALIFQSAARCMTRVGKGEDLSLQREANSFFYGAIHQLRIRQPGV